MTIVPTNDEQLRTEVRTRYAKTALQVLGTEQPQASDACCGPTCCTSDSQTHCCEERLQEQPKAAACCDTGCCTPQGQDGNPVTSNLYSQAELGTIPLAAALASLGCGNPTALAELSARREGAGLRQWRRD